VNVVATFVADPQSAKLMEPGDRAFDHPTILTQSTAMFGVTFGQHGLDSQSPQLAAMAAGVVRPIAMHAARTPAWSTTFAADRRHRVHQRHQLPNVVHVGGRYLGRKHDPLGVGEQMMLAARFATIRGIGACFFPPCTARTEDESITARDQSIWSAACKRAKSAAWIWAQTPARCQSRSRRQAVIPDPQPNSLGKSSQGIPVRSTNKMAHRHLRSSSRLRPGYRRRRFFLGNSGAMTSHNASSKIGFVMTAPPWAAIRLTDYRKAA
jgi:hypothetical protein